MSSQRVQIAKKFIDHFTKLDSNILRSVLAESYVHQYAPSSLPQQVSYSKIGLIEYVDRLGLMIHGYPMVIKEVLDSASSNAVTVWAVGEVNFRDEVKDDAAEWTHQGEYMFIFYFDQAGETIVKTVEFVDSKATVEKLLPLAARAQAYFANQAGS